MFLLKGYHVDWKASCTLCKQTLALEYKEIEQHATSEHKCPMHMFVELFYNKMKEEFEEHQQKEHQHQQRQQQQHQQQQEQEQQQENQEQQQQQQENQEQQQQQHDSCQLQDVMKSHQTGVPRHSKDEEKQGSQQKHTEKQHCNKGLKKQQLKHQEQQQQKQDQHQQEEVIQPHQKAIQEVQKEHQQKSRIVAAEHQELLQSEDAQRMLQQKTPSMESTNLNIPRGDIRRSGRLSRKRKLVEEEEEVSSDATLAEAKVLVERLSQRLITKLEEEGLKVSLRAAPIASGGAMCHRETEKEEKREGNSGEEGRMRAKTARGTKEKGEENMETEKDNNEKTRFSEEDGKEEKAIAGIAIAQREAETVEKDLELPLSIGIKSESNDDGEENGAGLSIVSVTSLSCCQQKGDHKELAECFDLDDFSVNGLEDQGRAPAFGSREVFACPQCGVDSKYFSSLMDVSEHVREVHS